MSNTILRSERGPVSRKARGQGATRRPEILAAAQRLFVTEGFDRATMRRIAAEVGVSATALYVYFSDKDAILRAIAEATFTDMLQALAASQAATGTRLHQFRAGLRAYIAFGLARPDEYRITFSAKRMQVTPGRQANECHDIADAGRSFEILQHSIVGLIRDGVFAPGDDLLIAEAVWACLHGTTVMLLNLRSQVLSDPQALIESVIDMIVRGLTIPIVT